MPKKSDWPNQVNNGGGTGKNGEGTRGNGGKQGGNGGKRVEMGRAGGGGAWGNLHGVEWENRR